MQDIDWTAALALTLTVLMPDQPVCMRCLAPAVAVQRQADRLVRRLYLIERRVVVKWRHAREIGLVCSLELHSQAGDLSPDSSLLFTGRLSLSQEETAYEGQDVYDALTFLVLTVTFPCLNQPTRSSRSIGAGPGTLPA